MRVREFKEKISALGLTWNLDNYWGYTVHGEGKMLVSVSSEVKFRTFISSDVSILDHNVAMAMLQVVTEFAGTPIEERSDLIAK
ncbi:hypothetical protein [Listeria booriae]|uniref:hypothetical protein n=1 Tax=Listeria booriae TaxID=1552123 RepID=UPI001629AEAF|nr:hypothetical protein [Listeria booriae]MBC1307927.1 hypothetical protein [Listeria booriae]MBC1887999.1 hypothetical protein [Listeria booriae]